MAPCALHENREQTMDQPPQPWEIQFLQFFFTTYMKRFQVFPLHFSFQKAGFTFAGQTHNDNTYTREGLSQHLEELLRRCGVPQDISVGGDFVIGHDYRAIASSNPELSHDVALSIFDTANHGFDSLFLASHVRTLLLSLLDRQLRIERDIQPRLFEEFNAMMQGPITRDLLENTNPLRTVSRGAVGIHGQFHTETGHFNFLCAGLPLFYYSRSAQTFFFLDPDKGPPLGYFSDQAAQRKPYVPHTLKLAPGDYLILATDGCFETEWSEAACRLGPRPREGVRHFRYKANRSFEVMYSFFPQIAVLTRQRMPLLEDDGVTMFCGLIQDLLDQGLHAQQVIDAAMERIDNSPFLRTDDRSLIVVHHPL